MKQLDLFKEKIEKEFGGTLTLGKRKGKRPIDSKKPTHMVLKAKDPNLLLRNRRRIENLIRETAKRFGLKVYSVGVQADHIHLCLLIAKREFYIRWIRAVTSMSVRLVAGLKWALRPYTRIVTWGREFKSVLNYIRVNRFEGDLLLDVHLESEAKTKAILLKFGVT